MRRKDRAGFRDAALRPPLQGEGARGGARAHGLKPIERFQRVRRQNLSSRTAEGGRCAAALDGLRKQRVPRLPISIAAPFPSADSIFSSPCGAISGRPTAAWPNRRSPGSIERATARRNQLCYRVTIETLQRSSRIQPKRFHLSRREDRSSRRIRKGNHGSALLARNCRFPRSPQARGKAPRPWRTWLRQWTHAPGSLLGPLQSLSPATLNVIYSLI
jgi:hypothetical protein